MRLKPLFAAAAMSVLLASITLAQDVMLLVALFPEKYVATIPENWSVTYRKAIGKTELLGDEVMLSLYTEEGVLGRMMTIDDTVTTAEILLDLDDDFLNTEVPTQDILPYNFNDNQAVIYRTDAQFVTVMQLQDGTYVYAVADVLTGEPFTDEQFNTVLTILNSVEIGEAFIPERDPSLVALGEPCWVSGPEGVDVRLRVGPGFNRAAITFLPTGEFKVLGRNEASDGSVWYQLDKQATAPFKDTAEVWVDAEDVEKRGDCDLVADSEAPPLNLLGSFDDAANNRRDVLNSLVGGVVPSEGTAVPIDGATYTLFHGDAGASSCLQGNSESFDYAQRWGKLQPITSALFLKDDGSAFLFAGIGFLLQGDGHYVGALYFPDSPTEYIRVQPQQPGRLLGFRTRVVGSGDQQCSTSVAVTLTLS